MANNVVALQTRVLARALKTLRGLTSMPQLSNFDFSDVASQRFEVINVPVPTSIGVRDVVPATTPPTPVDTVSETVPVVIDKWRQSDPFFLTDRDMTLFNSQVNFLPPRLEAAVKALAEDVNNDIFSKYKGIDRGIYGVVGTAGATPFASTVLAATDARMKLTRQQVPKTDRRMVLSVEAEGNALALPQFSDVDKVGERGPKIEGEIGRKYGFDIYSDQAVPTHYAGTILNASSQRVCAVNNVAGYASGTSAINVDNGGAASITGTIKVGDIVSFAGHGQTYCVIANTDSTQYSSGSQTYTFATNAINGLRIFPKLQSPVADNEAITVLPTHVVNLAFHRDAFAFVNRPLATFAMASNDDSDKITTLTDDVTGITMRLEQKRESKQWAWELDMLWGSALVRPELAVRILG